MTDKKSSESRRKLLKSIAAGSGAIVAGKSLPDSWSRPVVDSVVLPAHAQTSAIPLISGTLTTATFVVASAPRTDQIFTANDAAQPSNLLSLLIKDAKADHDTAVEICDGTTNTGGVTIMFDVPAGALPKTVDICIESTSDNSGLCRQLVQTTMATDSSLGDALNLDIPTNGDLHQIGLSSMSVDLNGDINGTITVTDVDHVDGNCNGPFTAISTGAAFSCTPDCDL